MRGLKHEDLCASPEAQRSRKVKPNLGAPQSTTKIRWEAEAIVRRRRLDAASAKSEGHVLLEQARILRDVIHPAALLVEPSVADTRWAKYGYVNAFAATEDFTRRYVRSYESNRRRLVGIDPHKCPVEEDFVLNDPAMMNALYRARQFADSMGIPYDRFVSCMMGRLIGQGLYRRVPLPNHLFPPLEPRKRKWRKTYRTRFGKPLIHKAIRHALEVKKTMEATCRVLEHDWDVRFLARNYMGDPAQERALRALVQHEDGSSPKRRLRHRLEHGRISLENARRVFQEADVDAVLREGPAIPVAGPPDPGLPIYRPHCLGLIQLPTSASECGQCEWRDRCEGLATWSDRHQEALTGYANRRERDRVAARDRKRASRERNRANAANAVAS